MQLKSWRAVTYLFRPHYKRLSAQMLTNIISQMNGIEVINIFKRYRCKKAKRERERKSPAFLFRAAIFHIQHILVLVYAICVKQNIEQLEMDKYTTITSPLQWHLTFFKDLFFVFVLFILVAICSKFTWKQVNTL